MSSTPLARELACDLLVVGSGAGGLSTAITARKHGLDVIVIEKEAVFGGTTAFSGGVLWIPGNDEMNKAGDPDSPEAARTYVHALIGEDARAVVRRDVEHWSKLVKTLGIRAE